MTADASGLDQRIADLNARNVDLHLALGTREPPWCSLDVLYCDGPALDEALYKQAEFIPGLDARAQAAYLIGVVAYRLTAMMVTLRSAGLAPRSLSAGDILFRFEPYRWESDGETGDDYHFLLRLAPALLGEAGSAMSVEAMRGALVTLLEPLVLRLLAKTELPKSALWRQAADGVASGFLYTGRNLGFEAQAMVDGEVLLRTPGSPLTNKQSGFASYTVSDETHGVTLTRTFRTRGGCCRYYTCDGGSYCTTCVLRPAAERDALLTAHLHEELAKIAAVGI